MRLLLLIGAGGFLGSISRYLVQQAALRQWPAAFPWGTLIVNMVGCFLVGIVYAWVERGQLPHAEWRLFLATGFCGGFTTFSAFSHEAISLLREGQPIHFGIYVTASVVLGLTATMLAMWMVREV